MRDNDFYNTTNEKGDILLQLEEDAKKTRNKVLDIFKEHGPKLSPSQVYNYYKGNSPLTSIRRAITNLTKKYEKLKKLSERRKGMYGHSESIWELIEQ